MQIFPRRFAGDDLLSMRGRCRHRERPRFRSGHTYRRAGADIREILSWPAQPRNARHGPRAGDRKEHHSRPRRRALGGQRARPWRGLLFLSASLEGVSVSRGRVLIVDDEPEIRRVLRMALVSHGYEITEARSGEEALETFREPVPEIVLLDLKLPGMGGLETCRAIIAVSDVPIIVLSARHAEKEKVELLDAGADDYLV